MNSDIRLSREYPHPRAKVWRALTEPDLMAQWGMRPDGFVPVVGTRFRFIGRANPGWRGFVESEVKEVQPGRLLAYSWIGNEGDKPLLMRHTLEDVPNGTRLTVEHLGFEGIGGFVFSHLLMRPGLRSTTRKLRVVLDSLAS